MPLYSSLYCAFFHCANQSEDTFCNYTESRHSPTGVLDRRDDSCLLAARCCLLCLSQPRLALRFCLSLDVRGYNTT